MTVNKIHSLPHRLSDSKAAQNAFSALPAGEREEFALSFEPPRRTAQPAAECSGAFMQNSQNSTGILY